MKGNISIRPSHLGWKADASSFPTGGGEAHLRCSTMTLARAGVWFMSIPLQPCLYFLRPSNLDVPAGGRGRGYSRGFVAADPDRAQNLGRPHPRTPIMWRLHADRGDNPTPGISTTSKRLLTSNGDWTTNQISIAAIDPHELPRLKSARHYRAKNSPEGNRLWRPAYPSAP
jgi:hypothetical protein